MSGPCDTDTHPLLSMKACRSFTAALASADWACVKFPALAPSKVPKQLSTAAMSSGEGCQVSPCQLASPPSPSPAPLPHSLSVMKLRDVQKPITAW